MNRQFFAVVLTVLIAVLASGIAAAQSPLLKEIEDSFVRLHEQIGPSVVSIEVKGPAGEDAEDMDLFRRFFGVPNPERGQRAPMPRPQAQGSGFIFDKEGHIITNNHVVEDAETILVKLWNGSEYEAKLIGNDPESDLAVVKIASVEELPAARLGDSDAIKVGQFAVAIGSARGFEGSVSFGHISAIGREGLRGLAVQGLTFQNLVQTDAAINLGNSGGPLCNIAGEVIGINTAIVWGANSIGFAVPVNTAKTVIPQLIEQGRVTRGYLGVAIEDAKIYADAAGLPDSKGALVKRVQEGTPADTADIRVYDVIRQVNGEAVADAADLVRKISSCLPGSQVTVQVWRDGAEVEIPVELHQRDLAVVQPDREQDIMGIRVRAATPEVIERLGLETGVKGVVITDVKAGSPGHDARLGAGDVIIEVAKTPVGTPGEFIAAMKAHAQPGKSVFVRFIRAGGGEPDITVIRVPDKL